MGHMEVCFTIPEDEECNVLLVFRLNIPGFEIIKKNETNNAKETNNSRNIRIMRVH